MTVENMQYDFRQKLNAVDSNRYRGFQLPEIDWKLNTALRLLVTKTASPKFETQVGFEFNQRNVDDLRALFKRVTIPVTDNNATLPSDYLRITSAFATASKGDCEKKLRIWFAQKDDIWETDPFAQSSFEWEELTALQMSDSIDETSKASNSIFGSTWCCPAWCRCYT
jgi:hypothetical protein